MLYKHMYFVLTIKIQRKRKVYIINQSKQNRYNTGKLR